MTTYAERFSAAAKAYTEARDAYRVWFDAAVDAKYAELRAADKAAGKDVSGKSVQNRKTLAHDLVAMGDEARARREAVDAIEAEYRAFSRQS